MNCKHCGMRLLSDDWQMNTLRGKVTRWADGLGWDSCAPARSQKHEPNGSE